MSQKFSYARKGLLCFGILNLLFSLAIALIWILSSLTHSGYGLRLGRGFPCLDINITAGTFDVILQEDGTAIFEPWTMSWSDSSWAQMPAFGKWEFYSFPKSRGCFMDLPVWAAMLALWLFGFAAWVCSSRLKRERRGFSVK